jgi:hypothetical protein
LFADGRGVDKYFNKAVLSDHPLPHCVERCGLTAAESPRLRTDDLEATKPIPDVNVPVFLPKPAPSTGTSDCITVKQVTILPAPGAKRRGFQLWWISAPLGPVVDAYALAVEADTSARISDLRAGKPPEAVFPYSDSFPNFRAGDQTVTSQWD